MENNYHKIALKGNIPSDIGDLTKLRNLRLHSNSFSNGGGLTGEIPESLTTLNELVFLSLIRNNLNRVIPDSICNPPIFTEGYHNYGETIQDVDLRENNFCQNGAPHPGCVTIGPNRAYGDQNWTKL